MAVNFSLDANFKGKKAGNTKRIQIHVVEAQGLSLKGSTSPTPSAYVTIESPGLGTLHQTGSAGKGKKLVWHENTSIVELKPTTPIKFTVKRQAIWPIAHHVLGSTDTYNLNKLIEMQGKNDRETCVTLSLNQETEGALKPSLVVNIRDLDTVERVQQVRDYANYAASIKSRRETMDSLASSSEDGSPTSSRSSGLPTSPLTISPSTSISSSPPAPSHLVSPPPPLSSPMTAEAVAATSVMSAAVASPTAPGTSSSLLHRQHSRVSSNGRSSGPEESP